MASMIWRAPWLRPTAAAPARNPFTMLQGVQPESMGSVTAPMAKHANGIRLLGMRSTRSIAAATVLQTMVVSTDAPPIASSSLVVILGCA